ncbi:MAG: hypothetical protein ABIW76_14245 [Fibrobacteria bacterium]
MRFNPFISAAVLAMVLAFGLALRVFSQNSGFHRVVKESLATTEGYDQKFIDLVDHLEEVLATRASFAYPGGSDPMTGRRREVAIPIAARIPSPRRTAASKASSGKPAQPKADSAKSPEPALDMVKLTAIIADDYGQHTAIVMDGERSLSVDVGDMVGTRKVVKVTNKEITMENDSAIYSYDISGNRSLQRK